MSVDFFTVPTVRFQVLYVFLVPAHDRRRILQFGVTAHLTAEWTAQQLREAFPWDSALLRDRDQIFGDEFVDQVRAMGIKRLLSAPRSPWQRAYAERLIGSILRECLDHVIVFGERSLHRTLTAYRAYYHRWRTHLPLDKDAPQSRSVQPPAGVPWSRLVKWAVCIITTNAAPRNTHPIRRQRRIECLQKIRRLRVVVRRRRDLCSTRHLPRPLNRQADRDVAALVSHFWISCRQYYARYSLVALAKPVSLLGRRNDLRNQLNCSRVADL